MTNIYGSLINGEWCNVGNEIANINPSESSQVLGHLISANASQIDDAVSAARHAQPLWSAVKLEDKKNILYSIGQELMDRSDEIGKILSSEEGKPFAEGRGEVFRAGEFYQYYAAECLRQIGESAASVRPNIDIEISREPIGVAGLITPWNFPAAMATRKIGPAIAAGCTMILKPASETPLTALAIVDIMERAGVPKGVINVILPEKVGESISKILHDPRVKNLSFTGSTEVGRVLIREAADRVIRCSMELGGNAPFVVFEDADIPAAVAGLMLAKMRNGGAACTAANRVYVQKSIADQFTKEFSQAMSQLKMGKGTEAKDAVNDFSYS